MFARWRDGRAEKKRRRRMDAIIEKLVEAGELAFESECRLQVPESLFDASADLKQFVVQLTAKTGALVRADNSHGLVTIYNDDAESDGTEVVVITREQ